MVTDYERYLLVRTLSDGSPAIVETLQSLQQGHQRLRQFARSTVKSEYYIYDLITGTKIYADSAPTEHS